MTHKQTEQTELLTPFELVSIASRYAALNADPVPAVTYALALWTEAQRQLNALEKALQDLPVPPSTPTPPAEKAKPFGKK